MAEERIPFTKITTFSDSERNQPPQFRSGNLNSAAGSNYVNQNYPFQKIITLAGSPDFEQRIYGIDIITPDEVIRNIDVSIWDGVSKYIVDADIPAPMGTPIPIPEGMPDSYFRSILKKTDSIAKLKVPAVSGTFNNWKRANVVQIGAITQYNKKSYYKAECKKPFSLFQTTQFSMLVNRRDEMDVPYISIPKGHSLLIAFLPQSSVTTDTKGVNVVVTGEKIYTNV